MSVERRIHGTLRLFFAQGDRSVLISIAPTTQCQQLARQYRIDTIYLQIGNLHIRPLSADCCPLVLQEHILESLGYEPLDAVQTITRANFRHIFAFFLGRPELQNNKRLNEILVAKCWIRRGRVLNRWKAKKCILYNGTLRIEHQMEEDEVLFVANYRVEITESRRGKVLCLTGPSASLYILFDSVDTLNLWNSRCLQYEMTPVCDLSDQRLVLLPDSLFSAPNSTHVTHLNLRRNSLQFRLAHQIELGAEVHPGLGWLEDLSRLTALTHLDLSSNRLLSFPVSVLQLDSLTRLILADNQIDSIPHEIGSVASLTELDLSNNWLTELPHELFSCGHLVSLNLSFNRFKEIPPILAMNPNLTHWQLAGNSIRKLGSIEFKHCIKLDLRRNKFTRGLTIPKGAEDLRWLDLRDNHLDVLSTTHCSSLQTLHCERNLLKELHVNGDNLTYLNVSNNSLSTLIVMPMPLRLIYLSIASNQFSHLPAWLTELPKIGHIDAQRNQLVELPDRIFRVPSLNTLIVHSNRLVKLPDEFENCQLELLDLHHNALERLPRLLFRSSHRLKEVNVSANVLTDLPPANEIPDLNRMQVLDAALNELTDEVIETIVAFRRLRRLNLAQNCIRFFDNGGLCSLTALEELNLSSNRLRSISPLILALPALQVLRLHSNQLTHLPNLSQAKRLKVFDACANRLSQIHLANCTGEHLRLVDLSCNQELPNYLPFSDYENTSDRSFSLVDVRETGLHSLQVGFAESTGQRNRLSVRQVLPHGHHLSPLVAIVDTAGNAELAAELVNRIGRLAETQEIVDEMTLKNWILNIHEWMGEAGERVGASVLLASIQGHKVFSAAVGGLRAWLFTDGRLRRLISSPAIDSRAYSELRAANAIVDEENQINGMSPNIRQVGFSASFPAILPRATTKRIDLISPEDRLIIGSRAVAECLSDPLIEHIVASVSNPHIIAKRIQDSVQAFGWVDNVSIIVAASSGHDFGKDDQPGGRAELSELTLQKIEERIEQISRVIARIEDEAPEFSIEKGHISRYTKERKMEVPRSSPSTGPPPDPSNSLRTRRTQNDPEKVKYFFIDVEQAAPSGNCCDSVRG